MDFRNIIVISDTHIGCGLALCHPKGARRDEGGRYQPSGAQKFIWSVWQSFWDEWVPKATNGEPYVVVHNGDVIEGVHHQATTPWSHNLKDQSDHAYEILAPIVDKCDGHYYQIRGTEVHVGKSAKEEEALAERLGAIPNEEGLFSRYELWFRLSGGALCNFMHHIGVTSSAQHETSAINAELSAMYNEAGRWGEEPPAVVCRSHRHRSAEIRLPSENGRHAVSMVTPAWQLKTPHTWKIAGGRITTPQLGGCLIQQIDGKIITDASIVKVGRSRVESGEKRQAERG